MDAGNVCMVFAPTILRDQERADRPSFGKQCLDELKAMWVVVNVLFRGVVFGEGLAVIPVAS